MEISKTLQPGDMGTKRFLSQYGNQLVCVRYRVDKQLKKRYTTIELIVDERNYFQQQTVVSVWVKIQYSENELRKLVKENNGKWLTDEKVWQITYDVAKRLGLKNRIMKKFIEPNV